MNLRSNPDSFAGRSDEMILSTLAHEMAHVWQQTHGKPPRKSYHDRQWAGKMREIGLQPSSTGEPGGKETGQSVTHFIIPEGRYAKAYAKLAATGFQLHWQSVPAIRPARRNQARQSLPVRSAGKTRGQSREPCFICGECYDEGEGDICFMLAEAVAWLVGDAARNPWNDYPKLLKPI